MACLQQPMHASIMCIESGSKLAPAFRNASSLVGSHIGTSVAICSEELETPPLQGLHVVQFEVANAHIQWHRGHMCSREVDGARGEEVLAQPLLREIVEAALQHSSGYRSLAACVRPRRSDSDSGDPTCRIIESSTTYLGMAAGGSDLEAQHNALATQRWSVQLE
jgi:hypothetical protein